MITTSQKFIEIVRGNNRKINAKVIIDYSSPDIDQNVEVKTNENNHTSFPNQIVDGKINNYNFICLDGSWTLGDGKVLAPSKSNSNIQMGWWGSTLSSSSGYFSSTIPEIVIAFMPRPIRSLKLYGDVVKNEYAVNFNIYLYDENDNVLYTEIVTNNIDVRWEKTLDNQINNIVKIKYEILKWSKANTVAKISEIFTSIQETYFDDIIISMNLLEEKEVKNNSLPVGNITSNELTLELSNENKEFSNNKNSKLYNLIKPNRKVRAYLGIGEEYVPLGMFWTKTWTVLENSLVAKVLCRDRLDILNNTQYINSKVGQNKTVYEIATEIFEDAGLSQGEFWIDEELQNIVIPYSYFPPMSHREALRRLATVALGQIYCDRYGAIRFEGPSFMLNKIQESGITAFLQSEFPAETTTINAYGISADDYFSINTPSDYNDMANYVSVNINNVTIGEKEVVYTDEDIRRINEDEEQEIEIQFTTYPCINPNIAIGGSAEIVEYELYYWGIKLKVRGISGTGTFVIGVEAYPLAFDNSQIITKFNEESISENGTIKYELTGNHLVQTTEMAEEIAEKILQFYKLPKRNLSIDWRGNPALELNDLIRIENIDGEETFYYITKQELEYAGYLRAKLEGRRAL